MWIPSATKHDRCRLYLKIVSTTRSLDKSCVKLSLVAVINCKSTKTMADGWRHSQFSFSPFQLKCFTSIIIRGGDHENSVDLLHLQTVSHLSIIWANHFNSNLCVIKDRTVIITRSYREFFTADLLMLCHIGDSLSEMCKH